MDYNIYLKKLFVSNACFIASVATLQKVFFRLRFWELWNQKVDSVLEICRILRSIKSEILQVIDRSPQIVEEPSELEDSLSSYKIKRPNLKDSTMAQLISKLNLAKETFGDDKFTYCLAAMCDRYILDLIQEKSDFDKLSLEYTFFKTRNSGKRFFQDIDQALKELDKSLLESYLVALLFAFNDQKFPKDLPEIKVNLFKAIYNRSPNDILQEDPFGCQKMNSNVRFQRLNENRYYLIIITLISSLALISLFIWVNSTKSLSKEIRSVYKNALEELKNA